MAVPRSIARSGAAASAALGLFALAAPAAQAHPLGNFSVNHYLGFIVRPDRVDVLAVTDTAEIPTLQEQRQVDRNADGTVDNTERTTWAADQCTRIAQRLRVTTDQDGAPITWRVDTAQFSYQDGSAGLRTGRLECGLSTALRIPAVGTTLRVDSGSDPGRVGWNEITARGDGTTVDRSDVPAHSTSDELRDYPRDLLDSPSGVTRAQFRARPGSGAEAVSALAPAAGASGPTAWLAGLDARLTELGAAQRLTLPLGLLAVLLSIVLGAGHALLPGHGKTVMAAYLAGRRGRTRDAVTVGATVTVTHTAGVIAIGLCLTTFSSLAGDVLLGWLGVASGVLVAAVGAGLLRDAVRRSRHARAHGRLPAPHPGPDDDTTRELAHAAAHAAGIPHDHHHKPHPAPGATQVLLADHGHHHDDDHRHGHGHHDSSHHHGHTHGQDSGRHHGDGHRHGLFGGGHHHHDPGEPGRRNLIGLGIAGGLVPSPSALVVLLGAIALGRTLFGAALVVAYGLGMAATLTAVGLLLVRVGDRVTAAEHGTLGSRIRRLAPYSALLTALLILTVGLGLVIRSLPATL
ncbi:high frequency lysogenization protein HflD [Kitasatospora sp. NPDC048365]|uniref:high frequency lysogenization protein HflD n=1 Tax=Kitasatospora sp. NPDC048365 TaxID=3364050 RepID=UPI0037186944